jgi:hypothetical protein
MRTSLGFTVTEVVRTPDPVCPDPFIATLEREPERGTVRDAPAALPLAEGAPRLRPRDS